MLTITTDQFKLFAEAKLTAFIRQNMQSLRLNYPSETSELDDPALSAYVLKTVEQLRSISFEYTGDISRALLMLFLLKYGTNQPGMPKDLVIKFRDPTTSIEKKLEALEQIFIFDSSLEK